MMNFECSNCASMLFFENTSCNTCGNILGYHPASSTMLSTPRDRQFFFNGKYYSHCANFQHEVCNWLIETDGNEEFCVSCQTNRTIPNLGVTENLNKWRKIEKAKHRLFYSLERFNLPLTMQINGETLPLRFDFLGQSQQAKSKKPIRTGHYNGLITLNIKEADPIHREYMKKEMDEPYRTLIGHFRHEIGHYYWQILVYPDQNILHRFRNVFGNETEDYGSALKNYYETDSDPNWQAAYISEYATSHPWEDWAETWAHYFHLVDNLETAFAYQIAIQSRVGRATQPYKQASFNPYFEPDFDKIIETYTPLSSAFNSINRSMGLPDLYPFTFNPQVIQKLKFVHKLIWDRKQ